MMTKPWRRSFSSSCWMNSYRLKMMRRMRMCSRSNGPPSRLPDQRTKNLAPPARGMYPDSRAGGFFVRPRKQRDNISYAI